MSFKFDSNYPNEEDSQHQRQRNINVDSLPWVEKYRPETLNDVIANKEIISTISRLVNAEKLPNLLLYGPPGTGKTSTILAIAKAIGGKYWRSMTLDLNASDERGIDVVRRQIKDFASSRTLVQGGYKLIILDEADAMTHDAQFALRRVIEKFTRTTRFCLICNFLNKIIPALQSRCTRFRFAPLESSFVEKRLREISQIENVNITDDGVKGLIELSQGDMRRVLNVMQSSHMAHGIVDANSVYLCAGKPQPSQINSIFSALLNTSFTEAYTTIHSMQTDHGFALVDILEEVHKYTLQYSFPSDVLCYLLEELAEIERRLSHATSEQLQLSSLIGIFQNARVTMTQLAATTEKH